MPITELTIKARNTERKTFSSISIFSVLLSPGNTRTIGK